MAGSPGAELAALREELRQAKTHLAQWHESWKQAKQACDAWKKEAEDVNLRAKVERETSARRTDEVGFTRDQFCWSNQCMHALTVYRR